MENIWRNREDLAESGKQSSSKVLMKGALVMIRISQSVFAPKTDDLRVQSSCLLY